VTNRSLLDVTVSEAAFQEQVIEYAHLRGWRSYHAHDSRRSAPGFPDLVLLRVGKMIVAELKRESGVLSKPQREFLIELMAVAGASGGAVSVCVWRPSDWPDVERMLR